MYWSTSVPCLPEELAYGLWCLGYDNTFGLPPFFTLWLRLEGLSSGGWFAGRRLLIM
jgi:hypothetical protein